MKKAALGFIALAMSVMATTAQAYNATGDIRAIDPCDEYGYVIPNGSIANPYTVGQTAYFRIRLENLNAKQSWLNHALSNPWSFEVNRDMYPLADATTINRLMAQTPPKVGVWVSGSLKYADVLSIGVPEGKGWYTDIVCSYTVKPGDLAFPMAMASAENKKIGEGSSKAYKLLNVGGALDPWKLVANERESESSWGTVTATNVVCSFWWSDKGTGNNCLDQTQDTQAERQDWLNADWTLEQAGLYIKTIDFAASEYFVAKGRTENVTVNIEGGVNTNGSGVVYAKIKAGEAVSLAESSIEVVKMWDGTASNDYQVAKVTIPSGEDAVSFSFKVKGEIESDDPVPVYLSSTKEFDYDDKYAIMTNFVMASVKCTAPPPPYISVTLDGEATKTVQSSVNYQNSVAKITVRLSEAHTSDVTVRIAPTMVSGVSTDPLVKYIGISAVNNNTAFLDKTVSVTFTAADMANGILAKDLYVYVIGGDDESAKGIKFTPVEVYPYNNNQSESAILYINKCKPVISFPDEDYEYKGLPGGVNSEFSIQIVDDYVNMDSGYTVEWQKTGSGTPLRFNNVTLVNGEAKLDVPYSEGEFTTRFRVQNAAGVWSDYRTIYVQVNATKTVSAVVEDPADMDEYDETLSTITPKKNLSVRFTLSEPDVAGRPLYAFLVPQTEASRTCVDPEVFTKGYAIRNGNTQSTGTAKIKLLDGADETLPLLYQIQLRVGMDPTSELVEDYASGDLEIWVNNVAPKVTKVTMDGSAPISADKSTFTGKPYATQEKEFRVAVTDVMADLTNNFTMTWSFYDPNGYASTPQEFVGVNPNDVAVTNKFVVPGTNTCIVSLVDKDGGESEFTFNVIVLDKPSVVINVDDAFDENAVDRRGAYFDVGLTSPTTEDIVINLECRRIGATGVMNLETNQVTILAGYPSKRVYFTELDGTGESKKLTGGFDLVATARKMDGSESVYDTATKRIYVINVAPEVVKPTEAEQEVTNTWVSVNAPFDFYWNVSDVAADLGDGLKVTVNASESSFKPFESNEKEGHVSITFTSGGAQTVTLKVEDKDGDVAYATCHYYLTPSKTVSIHPYGPYAGGALTELSKQYISADGRGKGRVWSNVTPKIFEFAQTHVYVASDTRADLSASGYRSGEIDSVIDSVGNSSDAGGYRYDDPLDSFFYAWVIASKNEESDVYTGIPLVAPLTPMDGATVAKYSLSLPTETIGDDAKPIYPDKFVEVFFSKEKYIADNMGDMNDDGIPDYFAVKTWSSDDGTIKTLPEAKTGQAIAGSTTQGDSSGPAVAASDLAKVDTYNDDGDFLPEAWGSSNPLNPQTKNWGNGQPFTALKEIRGFGVGLNEPGVSDYELTEAETNALFAACAAAGEPAADYVAATNWAVKARWTPEAVNPKTGARLNPISPDTDGDGLNDGWEYYFWYYAKVGAMVDGKYARLEGRRFSMESNSLASVRILSDEIAKAFDPHVARDTEAEFGIDFDNDGLTDLEEHVLGTNPCDWDSDGDGASDLWEVMMGTNPCSADKDSNPDCDFMARLEYAGDTFTLYTMANGDVFALPSATVSSESVEASEVTQSVYKVQIKAEDGANVYWVDAKPTVFTNDENVSMLASAVSAYRNISCNGIDYLGRKEPLAVGVGVDSIADTKVEVPFAKMVGFNWTNPKTLDKEVTKKALKVFNYGGDGVTYVPCTSNIVTYTEIPADAEIVDVRKDVTITLIHDQVYYHEGFDPRVAWNIDDNGLLDTRWKKPDSEDEGSYGLAGVPTNTVAYTTSDEYLLFQYRLMTGKIVVDKGANLVNLLQEHTTYPNLPVSFIRDNTAYSYTPFSFTNSTIKAYWDKLNPESGSSSDENSANVHGADTDKDGVPDGWELYVGSNPNDTVDGGLHVDGDKLSLAQEYAGVDSCNAYTNRYEGTTLVYPEVYTITKNNPGKTDNWWNKFFPTNPNADDTDGDGLSDDKERDGWSGSLPVGYNSYPASFTFIYGDDDQWEKYAADGKTTCFKGGGLNPCTVDTDGDLLPDAWEYQFAGIDWAAENHGIKSPAKLSKADEKALSIGYAYHSKTNGGHHIRGGMDGTDSGDASYDYDNDGLANFQEYLVQTLRHLRYDDSLTPLMGVDPSSKKFVRFIQFSAWDGNAFHKKCVDSGFTGIGAWQFRKLGYFALPPHKWDMIACQTAGISGCANYEHSEGAGYRVLLRPSFDIPLVGEVKASGYVCTDPRMIDTDNDGMDDYYELFHGLNPLLGSAADPMGLTGAGEENYKTYDVIANAYAGKVHNEYGKVFSAWVNHWVGYSNNEQPAFDAVKYPWMIGTMECDADGDGLRNDEESIKMDVAAPRNTHTDPTPLWMTDSTSPKFASFTSQYYNPDPYIKETPDYMEGVTRPDIFSYSKWTDFADDKRAFTFVSDEDQVTSEVLREGTGGRNRNWLFSFEENEGYDTDRDFRRDTSELVRGVDPTSDPLNYMDPNRRQALYLSGDRSAAVSYESEARREIGTEPDMLKQFTAECWICPEGIQKNAVVFERVAVYGPSTLSNDQNYVRANIRIGFDENGKLYGEYEGSTVDSGANRVTYKNDVKTDEWTHVALSYDGTYLALYINGEVAPVDSIINANLIPANGIMGIVQYPDASVVPYEGYRVLPVANIIGAKAHNANAVPVNATTGWNDFSGYFKGWVDEIRVWDGARPANDIRADFMKRYALDDVMANREEVYARWKNGANRAGSNGLSLPPELLFHYNFVTLPGGVNEGNVLTTPPGFQSAVLDNVRRTTGRDLDSSLVVGWWDALDVKSTVYSDYAYVPWIPNTVAHLPLFDGSTVDSRYWSKTEAGVAVKSIGDGYAYNNSANPYVGYVYRYDKLNRLIKLRLMENSGTYSNNVGEVAQKYKFQLRSDYVGSTDLVPLGGAFAMRGTNFWDKQGAMDAWTLTSKNFESADANGNGIPEWAEKLGLTTVEEYLRALALGLLPDATAKDDFNGNFKDSADSNHDGLTDWWQRLNDLKGIATEDADMDGLADFAEYLISDVFQFTNVNPRLTKTDGNEFDYFLKQGSLYLGEMFSDHDFIEDWWEDKYRDVAETAKYDPGRDADGDGWSNYAERRANTMPNRTANVIVDSDFWPEYPVPRLYVNVHYAKALSVTAPVVLNAYSDRHSNEPNATWNLAGSAIEGELSKVLGLNPQKKMKYYLGRDIVPGECRILIANPSLSTDEFVWFLMSAECPTSKETADLIVRGTDFQADGTKIGTINYVTGECEIDFTLIPSMLNYNTDKAVITGVDNWGWGVKVASSYFKVEYKTLRPDGSAPWQFVFTDANKGHVREGLNTFEAFVDLDNSGTYTLGEPFGIVRDVDVKWNACTVDIELKDPSENLPRIHLGFSDDQATASRNTRISVQRISIDGLTSSYDGGIVNPHVLDREIGNRNYLHEGDFMSDGGFDIDWTAFTTDVLGSSMAKYLYVTSVVYRVSVNSKSESADLSNSNSFEIVRRFTKDHLCATPVNVNGLNYGARPVFRWRYDSSVSQSDWDTYTAFSIQVMKGTAVVWNSGFRALPPRLLDGDFEWTAPICVGDLLSAGQVFSNADNYSWKISLHNARYQAPSWSAAQPFRVNVYGENEANPTGYGLAKLAVKYFGPGKVNADISKMGGIVRVEAYATPDFSGEPLGAAYVKDIAGLNDSAHEVNAVIIGLAPGSYYMLAYIDSNGNRKRDDFESWGYVCSRGDVVSKAIFDPVAIKVGDGIAVKETLYIEDVDIDQDCLPDIWEYDAASGKGDFLAAKGPAGNTHNGYIAVNPSLATAIANLIKANARAYMFSAGMASIPSGMVALSLGIDTAENTLEESTLAIKSIALENGDVNLTVGAEANEPALGSLYVKDNTVTTTIVIRYADSLNGEWKAKEFVKTFEIADGSVGCVLTITKEELLAEGLDTSKGFFKVELK